ncbi:MAG TPA: TonB family protein, partial [Thermoanaerobaculia bacterium]|nr:TonB family protein [Thermoanaerobaculia bacterium]
QRVSCASMKRAACLLLLAFAACQTPAPAPEPDVVPEPAPAAAPQERPTPIGTVRITASKLNVRSGPSSSGSVIASVPKGTRLPLLERGPKGWVRVALPSGETGWVSQQYAKEVRNCVADRDFRIVDAPPLSFSDSGAHGRVTVEATVGADGKVASTKVLRNDTGDPALAAIAESELRKARFEPPVRNCAAKRFIYTYERTF